MRILYLIPPSEGKALGGILGVEKLSFHLEKPLDILARVTEKDLKCSGKRFEEAQDLHAKIIQESKLEVLPAIERYSGVMYDAIDYGAMNGEEKMYFDTHFLITSGLYGLLRPQDMITNYKLPVEARGVAGYWKNILPQVLSELEGDIIVDLLPGSYKKMIDWTQVTAHRLEIEFLTVKNGKTQKLTHGVKKVKGEYIKNICEKEITDIKDFSGDIKQLNSHEFICSVFVEELQ